VVEPLTQTGITYFSWNLRRTCKFHFGSVESGVRLAITVLKWALIFFVISVVLGFTGISAASADLARTCSMSSW